MKMSKTKKTELEYPENLDIDSMQVYLAAQEREDLELIRDALGEKTLSSTIKRLIKIFKTMSHD